MKGLLPYLFTDVRTKRGYNLQTEIKIPRNKKQ